MGVKLSFVDICHASKVVSNDFYLKHFKQQDKNVEHLLAEVMGRDRRFMFDDEEETTLSLAVKASKSVLDKANLTGDDIDVLAYSSILSEYIAPSTSILIHKELNAGRNVMCFDMNANCAGMTIALENISNYLMSSKRAKRALVVGCDDVHSLTDPDNELCYGNYGHAACAIILEKVDEECGVIDTEYYVNTEESNNIMYPSCGFSSFFNSKNIEELNLKWLPFDGGACVYPAVDIIKKMLKENGLTKDDISMFCFSQFAYVNIKKIRELLDISEDKSIYIGDKYGYTGTTSPLIALYESIKKGTIKRGDYIIFWTIGAGSQSIVVLYKY
ncbi:MULTISPECIES: 3-oxoacyl-[acyl-carrier-protein] synthase III C-terminal domain-containing protein [unclassified Clostridium]|uniref:ketoacyl-ACP synthase III n=1 Tax=unclassified Clostridium TaxID=2614128 RepID=UPI0002972CFA|nr:MULTISPECIES: 3-oxoacyl-[acyl-carrier-protein] synthase III C-terminal domain-containing protein [unclassified Clostridium]EKQ51681.1 MAG: 3-oxoacyl-(acyl-carrier-protein) synthase III [Clostridium sp. Maddingley MBC34-26]